MLSFQEINWNGEYVQISIYNTKPIEVLKMIAVQDNKEIELTFDVTKTNNNRVISIPQDELKLLKLGVWAIFVEYKRRIRTYRSRVAYNDAPKANKTTRYLKPSINKRKTSTIPFLNESNQLEIHVADYLTTLLSSYQKVYQSYELTSTEVIDNKICFFSSEIFCDYCEEALLVVESNELSSHIKVELNDPQNGFLVKKKDFSKLKNLESVRGYLVIKVGSLIKIIYLNAATLDREIDLNYKYKLVFEDSNEFIFKVKMRKEAYRNQILRGELQVDDFKAEGNVISFIVDKYSIYFASEFSFYLKKRHLPERIELQVKTEYPESNKILVFLTMNQFVEPSFLKGRWDLFVDVQHLDQVTERLRVGAYNKAALSHSKSMFEKIPLSDQFVMAPYLTTDNEYSFVFTDHINYYKEKYRINSSLKKVSINKKGILKVAVEVKSDDTFNYEVNGLLLKLRKSEQILQIPVKYIENDGDRKLVSALISVSELPLEQFYWDFYVEYKVEEEAFFSKRLKNTSKFLEKKLKHGAFTSTFLTKEGYLIYPYITRDNSLSLTYRLKGEFESYKHKIIEYLAFLSFKINVNKNKKNKIWLIHEKLSETAQDNSFYFFKYCYEKRPDKKVYYVIKEGSEDIKNLEPYMDRVVYFMSYKHIKLILESKLMISSEAKGHGYAWRVSQGPIRNYVDKKKYVFLQHGVLGLKKVDSTFNYKGANSAELFVVSSDFEKEIVTDYFGYPEKRLIVTGLARWDVLQNKPNENKEIIFMPTWRNWLEEVEEGQFLKSQYYRSYNALLNSKELVETLKANKLTLNFYVHPKFMPYVKNFSTEGSNINVLQFGQDRINELIMRSHMLITDYSSVAWEMYYLRKPVLFYYFDLPKYMEYQGAYMDIEKDRFGDMAKTPSELITLINSYVNNGFKENPIYTEKREEYFKYVDNLNSERIFNEIVERGK